ncbi:hypothetical protein EMN47_15865 [Prolixibacteraceae bacterium JC049]|nr:hypothetical protein [Prolixibacteraceae bacterium JC049]
MKKMLYGIFIFTLLLMSCEVENDYYQRPDWLKGSTYEFLQQEERFSLYLSAVDRLGLKEDFDGKVLMTCFIPNDNAFNEYLKRKNYNSVADIPEKELKALINYTTGLRSFNRDELELYHFKDEKHLRGKYFRLTSLHTTDAYQERIPYGSAQRDVWLFNSPKMINFFSKRYFEAMEISDPKASVDLLFGEGTWNGETILGNGARIIKYEIPTDNGYVFEVDKLTDPLRSADRILKENEQFSLFSKLYDYFGKYNYESDFDKYKEAFGADSLFTKSNVLYNTYTEGNTDLYKLDFNTGAMFVPTNEVLKAFLESKFGPGAAENFQEIPVLALKYILKQHVQSSTMAWMEDIENGKITTSWGDELDFNKENIVFKELGSNGVVYGINKVLEPSLFNSVMKGVIQTDKTQLFSWFVEKSLNINLLNNRDLDLALFVADDDSFNEDLIRITKEGYPFGDEKIEVNFTGDWKEYNISDLSKMVDLHIALLEKDFDFSGKGFVKNVTNFSLIKYADNKLYINEDELGEEDQLYAEVLSTDKSPTNGNVYKISKTLNSPKYSISKLGETYTEFREFKRLLRKANLMTESSKFTSKFGFDNYIMLAPENEVILKGIDDGAIPEIPLDSDSGEVLKEKQDALAKWCLQYFISMQKNDQPNYLVPGDNTSKVFNSMQLDNENSTPTKLVYTKLKCTASSDNLTVLNKETNSSVSSIVTTPVYIGTDGIVYSVDGLF